MPDTASRAGNPLEISLTPACEAILSAKTAEFPRTRDAFDALSWRLAREPGWGMPLALRDPEHPGQELRMAKTSMSKHVPTVVAIYFVQDERLTIVRLRVSKPGYDPIL